MCREDAESHLYRHLQRQDDCRVEHKCRIRQPNRDLRFRLLDGIAPHQAREEGAYRSGTYDRGGLAVGLLQNVIEADQYHHDQYDGFHYSSIFLRRRRTVHTKAVIATNTNTTTTVLLTNVVTLSEAFIFSFFSTVPLSCESEASRTSRICRS